MTTQPIMSITDDLLAELESELGQILRIAESVGGVDQMSAVGIGRYLRLVTPQQVLSILANNRALLAERAELKRDADRVPNIEAAARKLAECMDYPWEYMPAHGRDSMRHHAQAVIDAAMERKP